MEATGPDRGRAAGVLGLVLVLLGSVCLVAGVVAGYAHRTLLDGDRFARSVDEVRRDPAVSAALGRALTDELLKQRPDAVAVRPLVDSVTTALVASDLLAGPTRAAAANFAQALTEPSSQAFVLRVADAGAVAAAALQRIAPPSTVPPDSQVPLELARIGSQSFAGRTIALARFVAVASWALPVAGVVLVAAGLLVSRPRRRAVLVAGSALLVLAGALAVALLAGGSWAGAQDGTAVRGSLIRAGWPVLGGPAWWSVLAVAGVGLLLVASAAALVPDVDPAGVLRRAWSLAVTRPRRATPQVVRALALVTAGVLTATRPLVAVTAAGALAGSWLVLQGVHELAIATAAPGTGARPSRPPSRWVATPVGLAALVVLVLVVAWGAVPPQAASATNSPTGAVAGRGLVCNGYAALCHRRYPDVRTWRPTTRCRPRPTRRGSSRSRAARSGASSTTASGLC